MSVGYEAVLGVTSTRAPSSGGWLGTGDRCRCRRSAPAPWSDPRLPRWAGSERCRRSAGGLAEPERQRRPGAVRLRRRRPARRRRDRTSRPTSRRSSRSPSPTGPRSGERRLGATSRSGVTIDGTNAFVGDQDGTVYAVSLETGAITWSEEMGGRVDSAVAVSDGQVVAVARNTDTAQVVVAAFDEATGERSWPALADPGELHGRDRAVGRRWFAVHRFGGPARASPRHRGRDRAMGDAGALAVLPGDLARVRRPERVRGGHRAGACTGWMPPTAGARGATT